MTTIPSPTAGMRELGEYLRQQRMAANLSVRQLSAVTGISNPYLSQIERGLRRPSADILQQLAQGLSLSAETLYVRAGLLDPDHAPHGADARIAIRNDPRLDGPQRRAMLDAYARIVGDGPYAVTEVPPAAAATPPGPTGPDLQHHLGTKEMYMNAYAGRDSDRDIERSPLAPLYAMVGASDLAVEKLVELGQKAAKDAEAGMDDLRHRADELPERANRDMAKALEGARQLPRAAVNQAMEAVAKGRQQYVDLARRGKELEETFTGQASTTAQGLVRQAGDIAGRSRKEAAQAVDKGRHQAEHVAAQGRHVVEQGRHQAEHLVEQSRHEAEKRVQDGRRVAMRTRRVAAEQADKVVGQAAQVVDAVSHAGRRPAAASLTVTAEVKKPTARRRRSPGTAPTTEARTVVSAGVDAAATTPTAKAPAAKKATAKKAASKKTAAPKRASSAPTTGAMPRTTKRATKAVKAGEVTATPADMPDTPAVPPPPAAETPNLAAGTTPSDKLPLNSGDSE